MPHAARKRPGKREFVLVPGRPTAARVHEQILAGFPAKKLTGFQSATGLPYKQILEVVGLPATTFSRRKRSGHLRSDESERLYRLGAVFQLAVDLFEGDVDAARGWFTRPARGLGGRTPLAMTRTEVGAREVERLIGRLEHGVFT